MINPQTDPRLVTRRTLYKGWNHLEQVEIRDGAGVHPREIIDHGDSVAVLPVDRERQVALLARQWRAPAVVRGEPSHILEACAGLIDSGESPETSAIREAWEELGVRLSHLNPVTTIWSSPGAMMEQVHLFLAPYSAADRQGPGGGLEHEGEQIEVVEMSFANLGRWMNTSRLQVPSNDQPPPATPAALDAKTLILVQMLLSEFPDME